MKKSAWMFLSLSICVLAAAGEPQNVAPSHGGTLFKVGETDTFVELVHDKKIGKAHLYIVAKDGKPDPAIKASVRLLLKEPGCESCDIKVIAQPVENQVSVFCADDKFLKIDSLRGEIIVTLNEKQHKVILSKPLNAEISKDSK